ncbi:hypothetical protein [Flavobacterium aquidurense]|uniref:hypothetical protein n=1 Tax=Flavobacterium aquidurense TaxID=362413 RepID=UPI00285E20B0|nr:hypothetical protein [Flavobacterium aquidurense]MDR7372564.1 hypothetical protein [Flavobacterium aquidurense]
MKKKLEADLISIAHRILKLKNKSDINQLYLETQKLYEKLAVLKFIDENFDNAKPTIGRSEVESEVESIFEKEEIIPTEVRIETPVAIAETVAEETPIEGEAEATPEPKIIEETPAEIITEVSEEEIPETEIEAVAEPEVEKTAEPIVKTIEETLFETKQETAEELYFRTINESKPIPDFKPAFELELEEIKKEEPKRDSKKPDPVHISFEDILGVNYADAQFVKVDSFEAVSSTPFPSLNEFQETKIETEVLETPTERKAETLNEKLAKGFHVDLNDRIAFTKNLFGNSAEDYSRVLNQLLTFDTYGEAQEFIETMVKPDYNNWEGKDDYAERFLGIVEKKFS